MANNQPFWKTKALDEMSNSEWKSLCDGCGKCCLNKIEDEETGQIYMTNVRCRLLDPETCRCKDYYNRATEVPTCVVLSPQLLFSLRFMPKTCSYRLIAEGKDLPDWHHLVSGNREDVHNSGHSVKGKTIDEGEVQDWEDHILEPMS